MRIAIYLVVSLIAVIGVVGSIGFLLPVGHVASRSAEFSRPPDVVFALIADPGSYKGWWDGAEVKSEVVERLPPSKLVTKVIGETQFGGTWTFEITPTPAGSRLTITERGEIYNPIFRALARFVFGYSGTMEACLKAAQRKLAA